MPQRKPLRSNSSCLAMQDQRSYEPTPSEQLQTQPFDFSQWTYLNCYAVKAWPTTFSIAYSHVKRLLLQAHSTLVPTAARRLVSEIVSCHR